VERIPATAELAFAGMAMAILIALPIGIISALKQYSFLDHGAMFLSLLGVSMPNFWLGPLLILFFSIYLGWVPVSGMGDWSSLVLPAITLGTALAAILSRMTRSSMLDVLDEEYLRCARAKGLPERLVILKHALRNALVPIITIVGLQFGSLLSGAIITEAVFSWPGIGTLLIRSIESRDYPVVQGCVLFISLSYVVINLLTDLAYALIDPRIRYRKG
jgi:peptide/nickel transport system permease protein